MFIRIKKQPITLNSTYNRLVVSIEDGDASILLGTLEIEPNKPLACKLANIIGDRKEASMLFVNHQ